MIRYDRLWHHRRQRPESREVLSPPSPTVQFSLEQHKLLEIPYGKDKPITNTIKGRLPAENLPGLSYNSQLSNQSIQRFTQSHLSSGGCQWRPAVLTWKRKRPCSLQRNSAKFRKTCIQQASALGDSLPPLDPQPMNGSAAVPGTASRRRGSSSPRGRSCEDRKPLRAVSFVTAWRLNTY